MAITDWPASERPREKLVAQGAKSLSDAELLAIFLHTGVPGETAVDLARSVLKKSGGLRKLLTADEAHFCQHRGLGMAKYALLQAALEIGRRHLEATLKHKSVINNPEDTRRFLSAWLRDYPNEVFACLFLNTKHHIICFEELFHGDLDGAYVSAREVVKRALENNAAAIILAHNHPSGDAEPSQADIHVTQELIFALEVVQVQVLDHIIIGDGKMTSFAEQGLLYGPTKH